MSANPSTIAGPPVERTLDLAELAGLGREETVRIQGLANRTLDLFERTLEVVDERAPAPEAAAAPAATFLPQHSELRARFKFAEVLGSYATLNTLVDRYAPGYALTRAASDTSRVAELSTREIALLEDYRAQIEAALEHASEHLAARSAASFSSEELRELNEILGEARDRFRALDALLGMRLVHDVEQAVLRLSRLRETIAAVQRTVTGVFLVDTEIMFVPTRELAKIVDDIFKAIGNPFVVEHIDGMLLLAARNLLIQVMSFYAYYGREQIYRIFAADQARAGRGRIATYIRGEIRDLLGLCKTSNKLILTRVMDATEREFEISVEAIQAEAANRAIAEVERLMPPPPPPPPPPPRGLLARLARWLFG